MSLSTPTQNINILKLKLALSVAKYEKKGKCAFCDSGLRNGFIAGKIWFLRDKQHSNYCISYRHGYFPLFKSTQH
jgi:hypothetical protein